MTTVLKINTRDLNNSMLEDLKDRFGDAELEIRVHDVPDAAGVMKEEEFWGLIGMLDWSDPEDNDRVIEPVVETLSRMPVAWIYQFYDTLSEKLWQLDTAGHAGVLMKADANGYLSEDEFLYARCCVVANGKEFFNAVLTNPTKFPTDLAFEDLLYVAEMAFERKTGKKFISAPAFNFETGSNHQGWQ